MNKVNHESIEEAKKNSIDRKFTLLFETAKRSILAAEILLERITSDLSGFEQEIESEIDIGEKAIYPLLSAVAFVDFAYRYIHTLDALPYIKKDSPQMNRLRKALKPIEESRHYLQHMRGDLSANEVIDYPLLGALTWSNGPSVYLISFSQSGSTSTPTMPFDRKKGVWISKHVYTVKHVEIDLDSILFEMKTAFDWINTLVSSTDPRVMEMSWGKTIAMSVRVDFKP